MDRYDDIWRGAPGRPAPRWGPDRWPPATRGRPRRYGYDLDFGSRRYGGRRGGYARSYDRPRSPAPWGDRYRDDGYDRGFGGGRRPYGLPPEGYAPMAPGAPAAQHDLAGADDAWIHDAVRYSLRHDGYLDADGIQVEVNAGVVTLRGEVQDYMQARYAWDDAWDTPGVVGVVSRLTVSQTAAGAAESGERAERRS